MPYRLFLPSVFGNEQVTGTEGNPMGLNPKAIAAAEAWFNLQGEARSNITFDERLNRAAQKHAEYLNQRTPEDIAARADVKNASHYGLNWDLANERVLNEGYSLPSNFLPDKNNVESISRSWKEPAVVVVELAAHESHEAHMLGLYSFATQTVFGVGCAGEDYVFLRCPPEEV